MENTPLTAEEIAAQVGGKIVPAEPAQPALTAEEQAIMNELKQGSGESDLGGNYVTIPYVTINNEMKEYEIAGGKKVIARCEPEFVMKSKVEDKYITEKFAPEFNGIIVKFMNAVKRKPLMDQQKNILNKHPYYFSLEFKSFQNDVHILQKNNEGKMVALKPMSYTEVKNKFADENELHGIAYFILVNEDGSLDNKISKAEFKGASRSVLFDYMISSRGYSVSSTITRFSATLKEDQATPYNCLVLTDTGKRPSDLRKVLDMQKELNNLIDNNLKPNITAEIVSEPVAQIEEGEVVVKDIPFA